MFNRQTREKFGAISQKLYGSANAWQKRLARGEYDVVESEFMRLDTIQNVSIESRKGQVMHVDLAVELGLVKREDVPNTIEVKVRKLRSPTESELELSLGALLEASEVMLMSVEAQVDYFVNKFVKGELGNAVHLVDVSDQEQPEVAEVLNKMTEETLKGLSEAHVAEIQKLRKNAGAYPISVFLFCESLKKATPSQDNL